MPVVIASAPFAVLFGALAVDNGMSVFEATLMSATLFAGASQMVGIELFGQNIAPWLVVFSIFAVNFRHVLYSAAVGRRIAHWTFLQKAIGFFFLVDPQYAESESKAERGESVGFAWYMGMALPIYFFWVVESAFGAIFGGLLPDTHALGIDFLLPIYFLGLVMGFRKRPLWLPVVVASAVVSVIAYRYVGSPWHVSIGAAAGIVLAAAMPPGAPANLKDGLEAEV
jgi:predicted branched-subunit amino acid permease